MTCAASPIDEHGADGGVIGIVDREAYKAVVGYEFLAGLESVIGAGISVYGTGLEQCLLDVAPAAGGGVGEGIPVGNAGSGKQMGIDPVIVPGLWGTRGIDITAGGGEGVEVT